MVTKFEFEIQNKTKIKSKLCWIHKNYLIWYINMVHTFIKIYSLFKIFILYKIIYKIKHDNK